MGFESGVLATIIHSGSSQIGSGADQQVGEWTP